MSYVYEEDIAANVVNTVLSEKIRKPDKFLFNVSSRKFALYPNGDIWRLRGDKLWKKKYTFEDGSWYTETGRPATILKNIEKILKLQLNILSPSRKRAKVKLPKGAKPTPPKVPKNKVDRVSSRKKDRPIKEVLPIAKKLIRRLTKLGLRGIIVAGSIRRKEPIVGDIDIMAMGKIDTLKNTKGMEVIKSGEKSITFMFEGHQVNLYSYKASFRGAMLLYLTGPGEFGVILRFRAKKMGYKLNQYGLWLGDKLVAAKTEEEIFKKLDLEYKTPEYRNKYRKKTMPPSSSIKKIDYTKIEKMDRNYLKLLSEEQLVEIIDKAADAYYNSKRTIISDRAFDAVWDSLKGRNPKHPRLKEVGAPIKRKMGKVKLPFYMGSLDKVKPDSVDKWIASNPGPYVVSDKMDGVSLGIDVEDSVELYTRGTGFQGQCISHLVPHLIKYKKIPKRLPSGLQVRCELEISDAAFKKYFPKDKNPRNTMSGLVNQKTIKPEVIKRMDVIAYEVISPPMKPSAQFKKLESLGFKVAKWKHVKSLSSSTLSKYLKKRLSSSKHAIDGLVIYLDEKHTRIKGENPKHARAYKEIGEGNIATAKIIAVRWALSKHQFWKPRIEIEPTDLNGVTIKFLTAFNAKYVKDNFLGPGAVVKFTRSGDVIPHIIEVVKKARAPQMPDDDYEWHEGGVEVFKPGIEVKEVTLKKITNFFSTIGVEGFKAKTIDRLFKAGYDSIPKIINITEAELLELPGIQETSAKKLRGEIAEAIKAVEIHMLAFGSGTFPRTIGSRRLKDIFTRYPNLYKKSFKKQAIIDLIKALPGYKDKTATDFAEGLPKFIEFLKTLPRSVKIIQPEEVKKTGSKLNGQIIVFTGFRDTELEKRIKENGGEIGNGVNRKTTILIVKEQGSTSSKARKAQELGIKVMSVESFKKLYSL